MNTTYSIGKALRLPSSVATWAMSLAAVCLMLLAVNAFAVPPAAGTSIGNQASATYTDASLVSHTVSSNTVTTTVQQVASLTLTANGAKTATVGSTVYYPHTLTNTGNGSDTFALTAANATSGNTAYAMTAVSIFLDNGSGLPTGPAITSTGALAAGAAFKFVVAATLPGTATSGQKNDVTVTGTSGFTAAQTTFNTDTTTVTTNAVINVTKGVSATSGPAAGPGITYTYTLTYTNTGASTATSVTLTDAIPVGLTYVAGSGLWSATGATALTDVTAGGTFQGTAPNQINYNFAGGTVTAIVTNVAPSQSGTLTFKFFVPTTTASGVQNNTANLSYNNGGTGGGTVITGSSNTVAFNVGQTGSVNLTPATVLSANPGTSVSFTNVIKNTGNGTDTFNITLSAGNFPTGTSFSLYKSDGATPLVDTNGDGIPDTGPLAAGSSYNVIVKANLPANASGGPYTVNKTATSTVTPSSFSTGGDTLNAITAATVDLTNTAPYAAGAKGFGAGPEATAQVTQATNPATTTTFVVIANNTGPIADSYNLAASTVSTFASVTLPTGWTVTFKLDGGGGTCATTGATITNTGTVNAGANVVTCAVVSVPAGFAAGTTDLFFRGQSPATGATDVIHDAVTVNAVRSLSFTTNNTGQVFPGGSFVYSHTLTNTGNVLEGNGTVSTITLPATNSLGATWTSVLYYDTTNNGLDAGDPVISGGLQTVAGLAAGLTPGQSITILDKVTAPSGATVAQVNTTTITATTANGTNTYGTGAPVAVPDTDSSTVIAGNVSLAKAQALDATCAGPTGATVYGQGTITAGAIPNACILYQITVSNIGTAPATGVTVSDSTPAFTLLSALPATTYAGATVTTSPAVGGTGAILVTLGTLAPGANAVITFGVRIQP